MRILIADKDISTMQIFADMLGEKGHDITLVSSGDQAVTYLRNNTFDLFIIEMDLPITDGFMLLSQIRKEQIDVTVISLVNPGEFLKGRKSLEAGAFHFLARPLSMTALDNSIEAAMKVDRLIKKISKISPQFFSDFKRTENLYDALDKYKNKHGNAIIITPSGGGGYELSNLLHLIGSKKEKSIDIIDCSMNSVIFKRSFCGYCKKAFLGAKKDFKGLAAQLRGGTLVLDNFHLISDETAEFLEECILKNNYIPVGTTETHTMDLSFIALAEPGFIEKHPSVSQKFFNCLSESRFIIPEINSISDFETLAGFIYESDEHGFKSDTKLFSNKKVLSKSDLTELKKYSWPGNFHELELVLKLHKLIGKWRIYDTNNAIHGPVSGQMTIPGFNEGQTVDSLTKVSDSPDILIEDESSSTLIFSEKMKYSDAKDLFESKYIDYMLNYNCGNVTNTAKSMGLGRRTLQEKMKKLGIDSKVYRNERK